MAYDNETVRALLTRPGSSGPLAVANWVEHQESTTDSSHTAAIQFWEIALALDPPVLQESDQAFARSEIARHRAALVVHEAPPHIGGPAV